MGGMWFGGAPRTNNQKRAERQVFKRDWTTCLKYNNYFMFQFST